ncbi:MAG: TRAP transporter substrate-binding protein [Beijerinckiaceae bacterium]
MTAPEFRAYEYLNVPQALEGGADATDTSGGPMNRHFMNRHFITAAGALALAVCCSTAQAQDKPVNLRLSYWVPPKHMLTVGYKDWAEHLKKASNGTITLTLFPSSQLGSGRDHYDMVKRGTADIGYVNPGYTPGRFPVIGALELPFIVADPLAGAKSMTRFYMPYAAKEMPDVKVCHVFSTPTSTFHGVKPIKLPQDVKGMRVRAGNATMSAMITLLGGSPVQVPIMEAYETLNRGITQAITAAWGGMVTFNFGKVVHHHLDMPFYVSAFVDAVNINAYNKLSATQKKVFDETCTPEWSARIYKPWHDQEAGIYATLLKDKNRTIYKVGPQDTAAWRKAAEPLYKKWAGTIAEKGGNAEEILANLRNELKKDGALYE